MVDARDYHEQTNHSVKQLRAEGIELDYDNLPRPYKIYENVDQFDPEAGSQPIELPALDAIAQADARPSAPADQAGDGDPDIQQLCYHATGVTKTIERGGEETRFRATSCTGKLYHIDLYAVTGDCGEFSPGIYHYDPHSDAFDVIREGDYRSVLADAAGDDQTGVANAPVTFVATSTWWRNAWKYRERTFRHAFWDSGTILSNLLAAAHGTGHRAQVVAGFADDPVVELLGLDPDDEAPLELIPVGSGAPVPADGPTANDVDPIDLTEAPLSENEIDYPLNADAWRQSRLQEGGDADKWRTTVAESVFGLNGVGDGELVDLDPVDRETASSRPLTNTVERRGSLREFSHDQISDRLFATVLDRALGEAPIDALGAETPRLNDIYVLVHAVTGIKPGAYQYHPDRNQLEWLGDSLRDRAGELALGQQVVADTAVNVYLCADVDRVVEHAGNRGYRLAQLEAGFLLGRLYLATYAHRRIGGRGFTFDDELVREHLSPRAAKQYPMTMFAFGKPSQD